MTYFRRNIEKMAGYVPGEQPKPGQKVIKLNTNENPYPPSPAAVEAMRSLDPERLRRYPDPAATAFRQSVSDALGVAVDSVIAGNGSDEVLTMILRTFVGPGDVVAYPVPTYVLYRTLTEIQEGCALEIPFNEDYDLPVDSLVAAQAAVTFIASPNSPSGTRYDVEQLDALAAAVKGVLVIDEAYTDFAEADALGLASSRPNVIVLRTLSKGYSLAGLRLGFGVADPSLLSGMLKVQDSYNVSAPACAIGAAAIADQSHKIANAEKVKASRARLAAELAELGYTIWPSESNFLLVRPVGEARFIYDTLKSRGILVRYFDQPALDDKLRITVGTDEENAALVAALKMGLEWPTEQR